MRPLIKPQQPSGSASYERYAEALIAALGAYCCFCEKALGSLILLFDKRRGPLDSGAQFASTWDDLLLICGDCATNMDTIDSQKLYLWPDAKIAQSYPLHYVKRDNVRYTVVDESGTAVHSEQRSYVFVEVVPQINSALATAAGNTIDLFRLNGKFYNHNPQQPQITIPIEEVMDVTDLRLDQRARVYEEALAAGARLKRALPTLQVNRGYIENMLTLTHLGMINSGYVSTWYAALAATLDPESLELIFFPDDLVPEQDDPYEGVIEELLEDPDERPTKRRRQR